MQPTDKPTQQQDGLDEKALLALGTFKTEEQHQANHPKKGSYSDRLNEGVRTSVGLGIGGSGFMGPYEAFFTNHASVWILLLVIVIFGGLFWFVFASFPH